MLLRRVYSSITPTGRALSNVSATTTANPTGHSLSTPLTSAKSQLVTRGRVKPRITGNTSRIITTATASRRTAEVVASSSSLSKLDQGKGRRKSRLSHTSFSSESENVNSSHLHLLGEESDILNGQMQNDNAKSTSRLNFTHPVPAVNHTNEFQPIYLYPEQFKLHTTFTHPHLPLPLYLGTNIYTSPRKSSSKTAPMDEDLFTPPPPPDPAARLNRARPSTSGLAEHSTVVSALSHPSLLHHLGDKLLWGMPSPEMEFGGLGAVLESTAVKLGPSNSDQWSATLDWLDGKAMPKAEAEISLNGEVKTESDIAINSAVADLTALLSKLGMSTRGRQAPIYRRINAGEALPKEENGVRMDSVKRKRKRKISKHKYKKRRKATRALRKRLGK